LSGRLEGKVAIVTGGARGQGAAHGRLFAEEGARVVLCDVLDAEGERFVADLAAEGLELTYVHLDISEEDDWKRTADLVGREFGALDILVNNAGSVGSRNGVVEEERSDWDRTIAINQTGAMLGMKHTIPLMKRSGGGSIVNVSSIWGVVGTDYYASYQASKGAVRQMTRSAALTYAADGIRVNTVCPGLVITPMLDDAPDGISEVENLTPMRRGAQPREVSYGVLYLASDEASFVTGIDLPIDGGFLAA
jgi:NAD(P)-dependent dehydrogenase (short-subunit alcohol dehydrogenase family)